jgi:hypothetical protein
MRANSLTAASTSIGSAFGNSSIARLAFKNAPKSSALAFRAKGFAK